MLAELETMVVLTHETEVAGPSTPALYAGPLVTDGRKNLAVGGRSTLYSLMLPGRVRGIYALPVDRDSGVVEWGCCRIG